jgi:hypothetical protein
MIAADSPTKPLDHPQSPVALLMAMAA